MSEKCWYLKRCDLFGHLTLDRLRAIESRCRIREFPRGTPIYLPAQHADGVLLLASGRVKICGFTSEGKQSILAFIEPGEVFGELAILEDGRREDYAEAVQKSRVLLIPRDTVQQLMEENPSIALGITKLIGLRRQRIERRLKYLLFHSNREKIIHLLLELVEQYGKASPDGVELGIKLSHQDLANVIGATRETVTVNLGELQAAGYLRVARKRLVITDLERMAASIRLDAPSLGGDSAPGDERPGGRAGIDSQRASTSFLP